MGCAKRRATCGRSHTSEPRQSRPPGKAAAHPGFDEMAPPAALLALRICTSYSTRLAPCIRGHLVRNAAHEGSCISLLDTTGQAARAKLVGGPPVAVIGWGGRDRTYECRNQNPVPYHLATPQGNRSRFEISGCREAPQRMAVKRARHEPGAPRPHHQRQRLQRGSFGGKRGENATSGSRHADRDCAGRLA